MSGLGEVLAGGGIVAVAISENGNTAVHPSIMALRSSAVLSIECHVTYMCCGIAGTNGSDGDTAVGDAIKTSQACTAGADPASSPLLRDPGWVV